MKCLAILLMLLLGAGTLRGQKVEGSLRGTVQDGANARIISVAQIKPTLEEFFVNLVAADRAQANAVEVSGK